MEAFKITVNGKKLDYRVGEELALDNVRAFLKKKYTVNNLWSGGRHVLGSIQQNKKDLFFKLATTEGISAVTQVEYQWNEQFNKLVPRNTSQFWVPQNYDSGYYNRNLFYLVTDKFDGELLCARPGDREISDTFLQSIPEIIELSEFIQDVPIQEQREDEGFDYREWFFKKIQSWYAGIPEDTRKSYHVFDLLQIVEEGLSELQKKSRHGDFTPWHLMRLRAGQLGLIDGEHAMASGVENYDIAYFIQRVFSELQNPELAQNIVHQLQERGCSLSKLQTMLAARGIGGFLDESLKPVPDYTLSEKYRKWVRGMEEN